MAITLSVCPPRATVLVLDTDQAMTYIWKKLPTDIQKREEMDGKEWLTVCNVTGRNLRKFSAEERYQLDFEGPSRMASMNKTCQEKCAECMTCPAMAGESEEGPPSPWLCLRSLSCVYSKWPFLPFSCGESQEEKPTGASCFESGKKHLGQKAVNRKLSSKQCHCCKEGVGVGVMFFVFIFSFYLIFFI